jgi:hypothetical protein
MPSIDQCIMKNTMPHIQFNRFKGVLPGVAFGLAMLTPVVAHAQVDVNKLFGKTHAQVMQMYGKPLETAGSPINYARFKTPGAIETMVWYGFDTGIVGKAQFQMLAKPGETKEQILKRYHLDLGSNLKTFQMKPPAFAFASNGQVPGEPWSKMFISYLYAVPYKPELMKYCKDHNLNPAKTWFWTIQVQARKGGPGRQMGASNDTGGGDGGKKGKKGGGKKRGG